jgi:predicted ATPase
MATKRSQTRPSRARRPSEGTLPAWAGLGFVSSVMLDRPKDAMPEAFPWSLPVLHGFKTVSLDPHVSFLVGENGIGKSTLLEAIAEAAGFAAQGGSKFMRQSADTWSALGSHLKLVRNVHRETDGFFLRAEAFYNVATRIDEIARDDRRIYASYGGRSPHEQSHGESFLNLLNHRMTGSGLYILDEPEAALSPSRQLAFLRILDLHVRERDSQFIIATHSPIIMAYPDATIFALSETGIRKTRYEETEHFLLTRDFLNDRELYFRHLFSDDEEV